MTQSDPRGSRAVLIGVSGYRGAGRGAPGLDPLPSVAGGVRRLKELLTDPAVWGLRDEHCVALLDPASSDDVLRAVCDAAREATDALLVYFAGHGWPVGGSDLCLMLPTAHPDGLYGAVRYRDLRRVLVDERRARDQVVVLDCCFSGAAVTGSMGGGAGDLARHAAVERTYLMTACAAQELAYAPPEEPYPAFTGELVRTIARGVPDGPDPLPMRDVFVQVRDALRATGRQEPQDLATGVGHEIALVRNRAGDPGIPDEAAVTVRPVRRAVSWRAVPRRAVSWRAAGWSAAVTLAAGVLVLPLLPGWLGDSAGERPPPIDASADPCALAAPAALGRFGKTTLDAAYGGFDRCDVLVERADGDEVDVLVEFDAGQERPTAAAAGSTGRVTVVRLPGESDACTRHLLPEGEDTTVRVEAKTYDDGPHPLCAMADTAVRHAVDVLNKGEVPRRTKGFPSDSLFHENACGLLDAAALEAVPGVDANDPDPGFADWVCKYFSTTSHLQLDVRFDRGQPPSVADGGTPTRLRGRRAFVQPEADGADTCRVRLVQRTYADPTHPELAETLDVTLRGDDDRSPADLCRLATRLADAATANLPPNSS
ncbi:caspase family protein [Streptomyces flavalbus]|uniref:Caspase domain-containing protein n=1 Tax=Streptomyces flavalbus TaxID=2665155 RepID=A0ABW2WB78_9ACTN